MKDMVGRERIQRKTAIFLACVLGILVGYFVFSVRHAILERWYRHKIASVKTEEDKEDLARRLGRLGSVDSIRYVFKNTDLCDDVDYLYPLIEKQPKAVKEIIKLVHDEDIRLRRASVRALESIVYGDLGSAAIEDALIDAANDSCQDVRQVALLTLGKFAATSDKEKKVFLEHLSNDVEAVKKIAALGLAEYGKDAVLPLFSLLENGSRLNMYQNDIAGNLAYSCEKDDSCQSIILLKLDGENKFSRYWACYVAGENEMKDRAIHDKMNERLKDDEEIVRLMAARYFWMVDGPSDPTTKLILKCFDSPDEQIRFLSYDALEDMAGLAGNIIHEIKSQVARERSEGLREKIFEVIRAIDQAR